MAVVRCLIRVWEGWPQAAEGGSGMRTVLQYAMLSLHVSGLLC